MNNAVGWIMLAVAAALVVIGIKGSQHALFPWLPVPPGGNTGINLQGSPSGGSSNVPSFAYGPGEQKNPTGCTNNVNAKVSPFPPFQGLNSKGCCPDGFSIWDVGFGVKVCRNMWNITIG